MNYDLIREIAVQAGLDMCGCGCDMPTRQSAMFAELIVKECNKVIHDGTNPSIFYQNRILRHFGVKE